MASSSSAKKVARVAAKSGSGQSTGASSGSNRNWLFGLGIVAILALGIGVVAMARGENEGYGDNSKPPKANLQDGEPFDHWHAAFAVEVCGQMLDPVPQAEPDVQGIHTHGDGLIHIHPFTRSASGNRATLSKFFDQTGLVVTNSGFEVPKGMAMKDGATTVKVGETTCGGKEGELVLAHWKDASTATGTKPDQIIRDDFGKVKFTEDLGAYTLAFIAKGDTAEIKPPASAADIASLGAADGGAAPTDSSTGTVPDTVDPGTGG
ncbi:MAG: hypothetical protein JWO77_1674 [Ilumatobacteraceae bacterium]|nr:hypothetical protein [Ilumatobacteraceae bacterium]